MKTSDIIFIIVVVVCILLVFYLQPKPEVVEEKPEEEPIIEVKEFKPTHLGVGLSLDESWEMVVDVEGEYGMINDEGITLSLVESDVLYFDESRSGFMTVNFMGMSRQVHRDTIGGVIYYFSGANLPDSSIIITTIAERTLTEEEITNIFSSIEF